MEISCDPGFEHIDAAFASPDAPDSSLNDRITNKHTLAVLSKPADLEEAIQHREKNSVRDIEGDTLFKPNCWTLTAQQLGKYGVGLELYFTFLKYFMILFLLIALVSVWPLVMNYQGGYFRTGETNSDFDVLTLANQKGPDAYENNLDTAQSYIDSTEKYRLMTLIADTLYSVMFLLFLVFYRIKSVDIMEKNREAHLLPRDFSIEVKRLPKNTNEEEVRKHFEQFGEVVEVSLARIYNSKLMLYRYRSEMAIALGIAKTIAEQKGKRTSTKIAFLEKSIKLFDARLAKKNRRSNKPVEQLPVNRAYVIFNLYSTKQVCLRAYVKARRFYKRGRKVPTNLRFRGQHTLKVKNPPEPSSILWENLELGTSRRKMRRFLGAICTLALMIISVGIMYWLKTNNTKMPSGYKCRANGVKSVSLSEAELMYTADGDVLCWCFLEGIANIIGDTDKEKYCDQYVALWQKSIYYRVISSIGIIAINNLLKQFLRNVSHFERVTTVTKQQQRIMYRIFLAMFINTAFITLVVNANFQDFVVMQYVPFKEYMFAGNYADFTRDWYLKVGSVLVVTMIISMVFPHCFTFCLHYPMKNIQIWCYRDRLRTQHELNQLYIGPELDIAGKTAIALNIIFTCFLYSGGIPLLNIICFVSLFLIYWIEKFLIVNYYRKPPVYSNEINDRLQAIMPYAILLHCGFSLYMYGSEAIWPEDYVRQDNGAIVGTNAGFASKIYNYTGITMILVMICTVCLSFFSYAVARFFRKFRSSPVDEAKELLLTYREAEADMRLRCVSRYDIMENPGYRDLIISLNHSAKASETPAPSSTVAKVTPDAALSDTKVQNNAEVKDESSD